MLTLRQLDIHRVASSVTTGLSLWRAISDQGLFLENVNEERAVRWKTCCNQLDAILDDTPQK